MRYSGCKCRHYQLITQIFVKKNKKKQLLMSTGKLLIKGHS